MCTQIEKLTKDRRGVAAIEYGLLLIAVLLAVSFGFKILGYTIYGKAQASTRQLTGSSSSAPTASSSGNGPGRVLVGINGSRPPIPYNPNNAGTGSNPAPIGINGSAPGVQAGGN